MSHKKNGYPKPRWLNFVPPRWINSDTKRLYAYLCIFGPDSCDHWNCRLAKKFYVSTRTIARRLRKLRELGLVWVANPQSPYRVLHPIYYGNTPDWLLAAQRKKIGESLAKVGSARRIPLGQKCLSESDNSSLRSELPSKERATSRDTRKFTRGNKSPRPPGGSGSRGMGKKFRIFLAWEKHFINMGYNEKKAQTLANRQTEQNLVPPG